jgi:hypothetical protein
LKRAIPAETRLQADCRAAREDRHHDKQCEAASRTLYSDRHQRTPMGRIVVSPTVTIPIARGGICLVDHDPTHVLPSASEVRKCNVVGRGTRMTIVLSSPVQRTTTNDSSAESVTLSATV